MPIPAIKGMGAQVQPAIELAKQIALNVEREIRFTGKKLQFYEMGPNGGVKLFETEEDWAARRRADTNRDTGSNLWDFEISNKTGITYSIIKRTAYLMIDDVKFERSRKEEPFGNLGCFKFRAQIVNK